MHALRDRRRRIRDFLYRRRVEAVLSAGSHHFIARLPFPFRLPFKMAHLMDAQPKRFQLDLETFDLAK